MTSGTAGEPQNTIPASPRALIAAGLVEFDNGQSRDTVDDCSSAGSEWGALPLPPDSNRFAPLADAEIVQVGPTAPDSVADALRYDLTHGDSDTDNVATILAGDVEHEDPAEEDEVRSGVEDVASEAEKEEVTFQLPGVSTRRA